MAYLFDEISPVPSLCLGPALSLSKGQALSAVEGPVLSAVEGPVLSAVEGEDVERILVERARRLALPPEEPVTGEVLEVVVLALGPERFGVDVRHVQEVQPLGDLTPVPGVPDFWAGLVNLRGHLYPVLDLRRFLHLSLATTETMARPVSKVVLVSASGLDIGLLADDVAEVRQVLKAEIGPALVNASGAGCPVVGITPDLLSLLDLEALFADPQLIVRDALA